MFFWSKLASVYNHCFGFVSLLIKRAAPSVWFLQESIKRPIRCCVSQGTDPRSAVRQRQTLCWGLSYAGVKIKAVSMECDLWTHFLANSADFMWENSNMYITEEHGVFQKMNARLIWGFSTVRVWILPELLHFYPFKKRKFHRSCDWQGFYRSLAWD